MSTDDAEHVTQQATGQTTAEKVAAYFNKVAASGYQPRLHSTSGACQFDITDVGGWRVAITNGVPSVAQNASDTPPADCTVTTSGEDFLRLVHREGHLNILAALLQGIVTINGDLAFAMEGLGSFIIEPVGASTQVHS